MSKKMRDKDSPTFKEATANMTGKEKASYIWEYYKLHILGSIALVLLAGSMVHASLTGSEAHLHITFSSGFEHMLGSLELPDSDAEEEQVTPSPESPPWIWVDLDIIPILEDLLLEDGAQGNQHIIVQTLVIDFQTLPVFTTHTGAGVIDIIVTHEADFNFLTEAGHLKDISDLGWNIPAHMMHNKYGVYLRYFPVFNDYVAAADDLILGIAWSTQMIENIENFFDILLD